MLFIPPLVGVFGQRQIPARNNYRFSALPPHLEHLINAAENELKTLRRIPASKQTPEQKDRLKTTLEWLRTLQEKVVKK